MKLRKFLATKGIKSTDFIPMTDGLTVDKFIKKIEKRGTEQNIIDTINNIDMPNDYILTYLSGISSRLLKEELRTVRIRFLKDYNVGAGIVIEKGTEHNVPPQLAMQHVNRGEAEYIEGEK